MNRRAGTVTALAGLIGAILAALVMPQPHRLVDSTTGDAALAARVRAVLPDDEGFRGLSVAFIDGSRTSTALLGDPAGGPLFEIGSVTKTFTAMLLADLAADGVVRVDEPLRNLLPHVRFDDPAVGAITLDELASHRSGLPRLGEGPIEGALRALPAVLGGRNPYGQDVGTVLDLLARSRVGDGRGEVHYSNFAMAVLGHALANRAGTPYPQLVTERILRPLGMTRTALGTGDLPASGLAAGATAGGRPVEPWSGAGYAPAGVGARSTAEDLAKLVAAVLAGTAPGADAARPRFDAGEGSRIGYAWFTQRYGDREITWHNGGTGGFKSFVGLDRASGRGVVLLGNTDRPVDGIGLRLLDADPPASALGPPQSRPIVLVTIVLLILVAYGLPVLATTPSGRRSWWRSAPDRLRVIGSTLSTVASLLVLHRLGAWLTVSPWLWTVAAAVTVAAAGLLAVRWPQLPTVAVGRAWLRWTGAALSALVSLAVVAATAAIW